jgi:glycosyltransferase involved in cell wall biosynthesis
MPLIRIISRDNGVGLSRDMLLLADALQQDGHYRVELVGFGSTNLRNRLLEARVGLSRLWRGRADAQIFVERVYERCLGAGKRNLLMPNPEWFLPKWQPLLPQFARVLCKTQQAHDCFQQMGCDSALVGFTSDDRHLPDVVRERAFFHLAGRSSAKGTRAVVEAWRRNPRWPTLTVVQSAKKAQPVAAPNIVFHTEYLDDAALRQLQNAHRFHICPSRAEGFGHYIMEGLSVGAVVLTTDGAPMNELVSEQRGLLIATSGQEPDNLGVRYRVEVEAIEAAVERALALDDAAAERLSEAARRYFLDNHRLFVRRLQNAVAEACGAGGDAAMVGLPLRSR